MHTQLTKWGNSAAIRLNKRTLEDAGLRLGDTVEVQVASGSISLRPAQKTESLSELLSAITRKNIHGMTEWGNPHGSEIW